jgi:hypothetical protein
MLVPPFARALPDVQAVRNWPRAKITMNMGDADPTFRKTAADQKTALARQRVMLAAHERQPGARRDLSVPKHVRLGSQTIHRRVPSECRVN